MHVSQQTKLCVQRPVFCPLIHQDSRIVFAEQANNWKNKAMHIEKGLIHLFELKHIVVVWYMYRYTVLLESLTSRYVEIDRSLA